MSKLSQSSQTRTHLVNSIAKGIAVIGVVGLSVSAALFSIEGVEGIESGTCSSCTITITGSDASDYSVGNSDVVCIASGANFSGTISRTSGNGTLIICNEGTIDGADLSFTKGDNYINNYGTIQSSTLSFSNSTSFNQLNNHDGAQASFANLSLTSSDTEAHNYGTFSMADLTLSSGATFSNYSSGIVNSQDVEINSNTDIQNQGYWSLVGNLTVNSNASLTNSDSLIVTGNVENNNTLISSGVLNVTGDLDGESSSTTTISGTTTVGTDVLMTKNMVISGTMVITGDMELTSSGNLTVSGSLTVGGDLLVAGDIYGASVASGSYGYISIDGVTTLENSGSLNDNLDFCDTGSPPSGADSFDGSAESTVTYCEAGETMPVEWLAFDASPNHGAVDLMWMTAIEENNDYFTVERSPDASSFESIASVKGAGSSSEPIMYELRDDAPPVGRVYYRIRQTDFDGQTSFSDQIEVNIESEDFSLNAYPNPTQDVLFVEIISEIQTRATVLVLNLSGQELKRSPLELSVGANRASINLADLPAATYLLQVRRAGASQQQTLRILKNN